MKFKVERDFVYKNRVYKKGDVISIAPSFETLSPFIWKGLVKVEEKHFDEIWKDYSDFLKTIEIIEEPKEYVYMEKDMLCLLRKEDLSILSFLLNNADSHWREFLTSPDDDSEWEKRKRNKHFIKFCQRINEIKAFLGNKVYMKRKPLFKRPNASVSIIEKFNP